MATPTNTHVRPPVIAVMGHVDHGKSTLLDYIRNTNVVATEAGGITQHVSAYEVEHEHEGAVRRITFLDTPGHEAFAKIRARGASTADIAILIVAATDGVKPQTLDAYNAITHARIPYMVAINKIDMPDADVNRTKSSLIEHGIYLEGMGGDIPYNEISAKSGKGIDDLLDTLLLIADLEELTADPETPAEGVVIEAARDPKKGIAATLVIKNGSLSSGEYVVAGEALAPVRIFENFKGDTIREASFSSPVRIIGFDTLPAVGVPFRAYEKKKDAELARSASVQTRTTAVAHDEEDPRHLVPLIIKTDTTGSLDAIAHELEKLQSDRTHLVVIQSGIGNINESDVQTALASSHDALIIAFNVGTDTTARDIAQQHDLTLHQFDIIYKLSEWLAETITKRTPKIEVPEDCGKVKVLKFFSTTKDQHLIGGTVVDGTFGVNTRVRIIRSGEHVGDGSVISIQAGRQNAQEVREGAEFGAQIQSTDPIREGDTLESFVLVTK